MRLRRLQNRRKAILLILLFLTLSLCYWEFGLLPGNLKDVTHQRLEKIFQQRVEFGRVWYVPLMGMIIENVRVESQEKGFHFHAAHFRFKVPLIPLIRDKKLILSTLRIQTPYLKITDEFMDDKFAEPTAAVRNFFFDEENENFLPKNFFLEKLIIKNGEIIVHKLSDSNTLHPGKIHFLNMEIDFRDKNYLPFEGSFFLGSPSYAHVKFYGKQNFETMKHEITLTGITKKLPPLVARVISNPNWSINNINTGFELWASTYEKNKLEFKLTTKNSKGEISWQKRLFNGDFALTTSGVYDLKHNKVKFGVGEFIAFDVSAKNLLSAAGELNHIRGSLQIDADQYKSTGLHAVWNGYPLKLSGYSDRDKSGTFEVQITQSSDTFETWAKLLPNSSLSQMNLQSLKGDLLLQISSKGRINQPSSVENTFELTVKDATFQPTKHGTPLQIHEGTFIKNSDTLEIRNAQFQTMENQFSLDGAIPFTSGISTQLKFQHPLLVATADLEQGLGQWNITNLEVVSQMATAQLSGNLLWQKEPLLQLEGEAKINLNAIRDELQKEWPIMAKTQPQDDLVASVRVNGPITGMRLPYVVLRTDGAELKLSEKLTVEDLDLDWVYEYNKLKLTYSRGRLFDGEIRVTGEIVMQTKNEPKFELKVVGVDHNLTLIGQLMKMQEEMSGKLNLDLKLSGNINQSQSLIGNGNFIIQDGHLWRTPLFHELENILFLRIKGMEYLTFNEAEGSFEIADGLIHTEDAKLSSSLIDINIDGNIGFDQKLDLFVRSHFSPHVYRKSREIGGLAPLMIEVAEDRITHYQITGTLNDPEYHEL